MSHPTWEPAEDPTLAAWLAALEARHLAELRIAEVTRALRALSSAYVERRHKVAQGATLDSRGKRAAFALFYAPLHFITARCVIMALGANQSPAHSVLDAGCGSGAVGAAWALAAGKLPVTGIDRHPWAADEARWTYRAMGLSGQARQGDIARLPPVRPGTAIAAGYVLNELPDDAREGVVEFLLAAASHGSDILVLEPISRAVTPWWNRTAARVTARGGRADEWRFPTTLPPLLQLFDKAAGLHHRELTARSMFLRGSRNGV